MQLCADVGGCGDGLAVGGADDGLAAGGADDGLAADVLVT